LGDGRYFRGPALGARPGRQRRAAATCARARPRVATPHGRFLQVCSVIYHEEGRMSDHARALSTDEQRLASLGYKQELHRGWSGFSNFAISLTIICILSGCFTTYGQAWNDGGPIAISIGWPVISILVLLVGLSMAELASKYPTAGGIYYWAY